MAICIDNNNHNNNFISDSLCRFVKSCKPNFSNQVSSCYSINQTPSPIEEYYNDDLWLNVRKQAHLDIQQEPILFNFYYSSILSHNSLENALAHNLAVKLSNANLSIDVLCEVFASVFGSDLEVKNAIRDDLRAIFERDPACTSYVHCFLHFKGFLACQAHRVAHKFWKQGRKVMALLIQSRISEVFAVDIHPGAKIGHGIVLDHATGIVIGETSVVGDNVTILHNVTLGGTGKVFGDRHPKIGDGVLIGAGAKILGNVRIGAGAKIGAGSVVLKEVPCEHRNQNLQLGGDNNKETIDSFSIPSPPEASLTYVFATTGQGLYFISGPSNKHLYCIDNINVTDHPVWRRCNSLKVSKISPRLFAYNNMLYAFEGEFDFDHPPLKEGYSWLKVYDIRADNWTQCDLHFVSNCRCKSLPRMIYWCVSIPDLYNEVKKIDIHNTAIMVEEKSIL
ncbi:hypothetical protein ACFE04_000961 [Oxalis oulophora]